MINVPYTEHNKIPTSLLVAHFLSLFHIMEFSRQFKNFQRKITNKSTNECVKTDEISSLIKK